MPGDKDDRRLHTVLLQISEQLQTAFARHDHIGKNQIEGFRAKQLEGARGIVTNRGFMTRQPEGAGKRRQRVRIIVDQEEMSFAGQALVPFEYLD